jgi:DNA-binding transcriptional LysR family regulator
MRRGDIADLSAFVAVADNLSFRAAAARLGVTPSALSHTMRLLEERLGARLLHRTTRSVSVTDTGLRLLERLRPAIAEIDGALEDLKEERHRPSGQLRIHATHVAAMAVIVPVWARFLATYPDVQLEVEIDEGPVDMAAKGFDAGVGQRYRAAQDMVAVPVTGPMTVSVVGAPTYFARRAAPRTPRQLDRHSCVEYRRVRGTILPWRFERNGKSVEVHARGPVVVNSIDLAVRAAADGLGIAYGVAPLTEPFLRTGQLVRILADWSPSFEGLFLYYHRHRQIPAALRALIDMIRRERELAGKARQNPFTEGWTVEEV